MRVSAGLVTSGAIALMLLIGGTSTATAAKGCGKISPGDNYPKLTIRAKGISCHTARKVARKFFNGKESRGFHCRTGEPAVCKNGNKKVIIKPGYYADRVAAMRHGGFHKCGKVQVRFGSYKVKAKHMKCDEAKRVIGYLVDANSEAPGFQCSGAPGPKVTCRNGRKVAKGRLAGA